MNVAYLRAADLPAPDAAWLAAARAAPALPTASSPTYEARTAFDAFDDMERTASRGEVAALVAAHSDPFLLFPEPRSRPIRMVFHPADAADPLPDLPASWATAGPGDTLDAGAFKRGEYGVFQIGVFASLKNATNVTYAARGFPYAVNCFNVEGVDDAGRPFARTYAVPHLQVGALWFGMQVPADAPFGAGGGAVDVLVAGDVVGSVEVSFRVNGTAPDGGDGDLRTLSRSRWLDSRVGQTNTTAERHTPVVVDKERRTLETWAARVVLGADGLPTAIARKGKNMLAGAVSLLDATACEPLAWTTLTDDLVAWTAACAEQTVAASLDADGTLLFDVRVESARADDVALTVPLNATLAKYSMGLGGSRRDAARHGVALARAGPVDATPSGYANYLVWLGNVDLGLRVKLLGQEDSWLGALHSIELHALYGGVNVSEAAPGVVDVVAFAARPRGTGLVRFELAISPTNALDTAAHFGDLGRHYQWSAFAPPNATELFDAGVRVLNVHQGVDVVNPYINYPFEPESVAPLSTIADAMHARGGRVKLYYTTRELSDHAEIIWLLKALGDGARRGRGVAGFRNTAEKVGGASWLQEHLHSGYRSTPPANLTSTELLDAAVCDSQTRDPHQRWSNFYVEGLRWLVEEKPASTASTSTASRTTASRSSARKLMDDAKPGCLVDLHSGNNLDLRCVASRGTPTSRGAQVRESPGFAVHAPVPYMDSLMLGEGYAPGYDRPAGVPGGGPDWWLVEVSGIPFGLMNDMLGRRRRSWRGFVFGSVTRLPYSSLASNQQVWKVWDDYELETAEMIGFWDDAGPAVSPAAGCGGGGALAATAYVHAGNVTLVAVASWANATLTCDLVAAATYAVHDGKVRGVTVPPQRAILIELRN
ncbi:hypothetical protein JL720_10667 [Aureococcus anophagefferens]|nr:hypothetical protein JL720_10667 [Aureococcus anophagefferens]